MTTLRMDGTYGRTESTSIDQDGKHAEDATPSKVRLALHNDIYERSVGLTVRFESPPSPICVQKWTARSDLAAAFV